MSSIPSLLASLRNDDDANKGDDDWSSKHSFDARLLRLLETIGEDIFREKSSRVRLKMKHADSIAEKVNVRLNACKIELERMGNSIGVERKVEDVVVVVDDDDDDDDDDETVERGELGD